MQKTLGVGPRRSQSGDGQNMCHRRVLGAERGDNPGDVPLFSRQKSVASNPGEACAVGIEQSTLVVAGINLFGDRIGLKGKQDLTDPVVDPVEVWRHEVDEMIRVAPLCFGRQDKMILSDCSDAGRVLKPRRQPPHNWRSNLDPRIGHPQAVSQLQQSRAYRIGRVPRVVVQPILIYQHLEKPRQTGGREAGLYGKFGKRKPASALCDTFDNAKSTSASQQ